MDFLKPCRWLWRNGLIRTILAFLLLVLILRFWVNWIGARRWREVRAMLVEEGETLNARAECAEPVPEAENFCAIPLLKEFGLTSDGSEGGQPRARLEALAPRWAAGNRAESGGAALGQRTDLKKWAVWLHSKGKVSDPALSGNAPVDVLAALDKSDGVVWELTAGLARPRAQWLPAWKTRDLPRDLLLGPLPPYAMTARLCQILAVRGIAAARAGDPVKAHESLQILARLSQACLDDPVFAGLMAGCGGTYNLTSATWELCDAQSGTAEDFSRLESALTALDFREATLRASRCRLAAVVDLLQSAAEGRDQRRDLIKLINLNAGQSADADTATERLVVWSLPSGLFDANCAVFAECTYIYQVRPLRDEGWRAGLRLARQFEGDLEEMKKKVPTHPSLMLTVLLAPSTPNMIRRVIYAQATASEAVIACALERYRIERGSYPDSLDSVRLVGGQPLPLDVLNGKPMGYRKTADGKYALWSAGFQPRSQGGKRVLDRGNRTRFYDESYSGDWVWDFPAK